MRKQIINAKIILQDRILENGVCCFTNGIIDYIGQTPQKDAVTVMDANNDLLFPGFVDIHCHGGAGYDFMDADIDEIERIGRFHLSHGTTSLLATTMTDSWEHIRTAVERISKFVNINSATNICGIHLEGPWLAPNQCGAQATAYMDTPNADLLDKLIAQYPIIQRVSAAPELPGAHSVGRKGSDMGLVMSVAHTDADFDQIEQAASQGYTLMTHLYSGMKQTQRVNAFRVAGAVEAGLYDDRLYVELIADGKHLPDALLKFVHRCKGPEKICLITDAMRGAGLGDGCQTKLGRMHGGVDVIIEDGVAKLPDRSSFAGSVATTDHLLRTMHNQAGINIIDVSKMLSGTPAKVMGYTDRGEIKTGKRADFVLMNDDLFINKVILNGEIV